MRASNGGERVKRVSRRRQGGTGVLTCGVRVYGEAFSMSTSQSRIPGKGLEETHHWNDPSKTQIKCVSLPKPVWLSG